MRTILGVSGSLRSTSSNTALLRAAAALLDDADGRIEGRGRIEIYDGLGALPHFSPDLDVEPRPAPVAALRATLARVDALFVSSPEYAHGMPGALKNMLDWLVSSTEAMDKPVLLLSASPGGAAHAHAQLAEVLRTMNLRLVDGGAHVFSRAMLDASGAVSAPELRDVLRLGLEHLLRTVAEVPARLR